MIGKTSNLFKCFCRNNIDINNSNEFKNHISLCADFQSKSPMTKFFNGLKIDRLTTEEMQILKCEMELKLQELQFNLEMKREYNGFGGFTTEKPNDSLTCESCSKPYDFSEMHFLDACVHSFCKKCLSSHIIESMKQGRGSSCLTCGKAIAEYEKRNILGEDLYNKINDEVSLPTLPTVKCVKCPQAFVFEPGKIQGNLKDEQGNKLNEEKERHYVENRFKCPSCNTEQCKKCSATPYHLGKTCEENKKLKESKLCKYCEEPIEQAYDAIPDICNRLECIEKTKDACHKYLACGHSCSGYKNEKKCLPCLTEQCQDASTEALNGQTGDDFCMICGVERLINAPCIQASCGHVFHLKCISTRILKRWHRPRITFAFCLCPLCKRWLEFPEDSPLQHKINEYKKLFDDIKRKSLERLKYEKRDKDERLTTLGDAYYQKPTEYAIAIYSYYECFKCKKPYFGGLKRCEDLMQEEAKNDEFKPEELVCAECSSVGITLENCPKHGKEFIEFKCRYCCSIATWFCWGTTHFCEPCHKRQCSGDYVSKYAKDKLPKCGGKNSCPLKVDHNGNGDEFVLGCALCRNLVNSHDF